MKWGSKGSEGGEGRAGVGERACQELQAHAGVESSHRGIEAALHCLGVDASWIEGNCSVNLC